jgi:hypothetical protein
MDLTIDNGQDGAKVINPTWIQIEDSLRQIDSEECCFLILTADTGRYLQCAGGPLGVTLEFRETLNDKFRHFILGKVQVASALKTIWSTIDCRVGPIRVHKGEVISLNEAIEAFRYFFQNADVPADLTRRNVTKHFNV